MKKLLLVGVMSLAFGGAAFAGDTPADVATALRQGNLPLAEQELRQAIGEHPQSAKAHYELAQVLAHEGNIGDAQREANQAQQLDPKLGFTDPARFEHFQSELHQALAPAGARVVERTQSGTVLAPQPHASVWPWIIGAIVLVLLFGFFRRRRQADQAAAFGNNGPYGPTRPQTPPYPPAGGYPPGYPPQPPAAGGSGLGGAFVGGLAGGALGAAAVEMFEGHERRVDDASFGGAPGGSVENNPQGQAYDDLRNSPIDTGNDDSSWGGGGSDGFDSGSDDDSWS